MQNFLFSDNWLVYVDSVSWRNSDVSFTVER